MAKRRRYRFPGMDPWLEHPTWWPGVHHDLTTDIARELNARIAPRYVARYGIRVIVEEFDRRTIAPDVVVMRGSRESYRGYGGERIDPAITLETEPLEVEQAYVEVHLTGPAGRLVTVIEVLSPTNKTPGSDGTQKYLQKQREVLSSDVHLVEIDLLRGGTHVASVQEVRLRTRGPYEYLVVIRRADRKRLADVYAIRVRDRLPRIPVPLAEGDPDAAVDLQAIVEGVYERGALWTLLDYAKPPVPPLAPEHVEWAATCLGKKGRRSR